MTKLFIIGATGFIGGDALYTIAHAHPEYEITALVRNSDKGAQVASQYAKVKLVYGDLDSHDLIVEEAKKADIVCNFANADHEGAAKSIIAGLSQRPLTSPPFYIHTSGTGNLTHADLSIRSFGNPSTKIHDDTTNLPTVLSLPAPSLHTNVDRIVLAAPSPIKQAIVCPPTIYGQGRGPANQRSLQLPGLAHVTLQRGKGFMVGEGRNLWCGVHVHDLSALYLLLVEAAAAGGGNATWGSEHGFYFAENGEFAWGDVSRAVAREACKRGLIADEEVESLGEEEVEGLFEGGSYAWGTNSRSRALRARELLGWHPGMESLWETVGDVVEAEAKALGLVRGHAVEAAGSA
ncbi:NAD(P)-binding protein [Saccharata proteae CBS 121410]|uniref:NAD(P)-binding protein n=1 Tax=Saccharata proteae CBS 121410 TaxID=1314787 RepID=A0A9P4LVY3_9PEZI|nr:NAD(P)-binding protein [Saccharata proteae CBS 121410]